MVELTDALGAFLGHISTYIRRQVGAEGGSARPTIRPLPSAARHWFEEAESTAPWEGLVKACVATLRADGYGKSPSVWRAALRHWFRQSGPYVDCLRFVDLDLSALTERLIYDIRRTDEKVTLLGLFEGVQFSGAGMDLGEFAIVRPSSTELEALLGVETNRIFYPHATTSTSRLSEHWYVTAQSRGERRKIGRIYFQDPFSEPVRPQYTQFAPLIEAALKRIVLWDWVPRYVDGATTEFEGETPWHGFSIPFVIAISDDPFKRPPSAPPVEDLYYEPVVDPSGEEIGERPGVLFTLNDSETRSFELFLREIDGQLRSVHDVAGDDWNFVELALSNLTKAFFSSGLEQMLWHIVALEALLGENRGRITERLSRRLASVYSGDESRAHKAGMAFRRLYELRGDLVHGRPFKTEVHQGQLRVARTLSRVVALRMLMLLTYVSKEQSEGRLGSLPSREEILGALDYERRAATRLADLLRSVLPFLADDGSRRC